MFVSFFFPLLWTNHSRVQSMRLVDWCTYDTKHKMSSLFVLYEYIYIFFFFCIELTMLFGGTVCVSELMFSLWIWPCLYIFSISKVRQRQLDNANKLHTTLPWESRTLFANSLRVGDTYSWLMDRPPGSRNAVFTVHSEEWVPYERVGKEPLQKKTGPVQVNTALLKGYCQYSLC